MDQFFGIKSRWSKLSETDHRRAKFPKQIKAEQIIQNKFRWSKLSETNQSEANYQK